MLTQSRFRSDPQAPHAGFLPARHPMEWYDGEVQRMRQWLDRFEVDLRFLAETRTRMDAVLKDTQAQLDEEQRAEEEAGRRRADEATARSAAAIAQIHQSHHAEVDGHLEAMRKAQGAMARGEAAARAADTLAFRSAQRRTDPGPHQARSREAQQAVRGAARQVGESRRAIEKVHERQRASLEAVLAQAGEVERANAQLLAERELFRDEFVAAATEALQSIDGQIAARSTQRNVLAGYFLPFPALAPVRVVWLPLWMATLRSPKGVRQVAFPPMQVRGGVGLGGTLKRLLGGIVLPLEPRTAQFDKVLRPTMEEAVARDPWLSAATQELTRAADVLVDPDLLVRLQEGLSDLRSQGWVSKKQEEEYFRVYSDRARRRAESGRPAPSAVPPGPRVEGASAPGAGPRAPPPGPS